MRVLKVLLCLGLIGMVATVWSRRAPVVEAYTEDREPLELHFDGFEVAVQRADLGPSPYQVSATRPDLTDADPGTVRPLSIPSVSSTIAGGSGHVTGRVVGPAGPLAGATVVVERHTLDGVDQVTLSTGEDGTFAVDGVVGGRYRVRGYVPNTFGSDSTHVFFLVDGQTSTAEIVLRAPTGGAVVDLVAGGPTLLGSEYTVAVSVGREAIDGEGRFVISPVAGVPVGTAIGGAAVLQSAATALTDAGGAARFTLRCDAVGPTAMTADVPLPALDPLPEAGPAPAPAASTQRQFSLPVCVESLPEPVDPATPVTVEAGPLDD